MRYILTLTVAAIAIITLIPSTYASGYPYLKLRLRVYENGLVMVNATLTPSSATLKLKLLGTPLKNLPPLVFDERNRPLAHREEGDYLLIYNTSLAEEVNVIYFTYDLTFKDGPIWMLKADLPTNSTVVLPRGAVVVDLSSVPSRIDSMGGSLILGLPPGEQYVKYVLTSVTLTNKPESRGSSLFLLLLILPTSAAIITIILIVKVRGGSKYVLTPEEEALIRALKRRGGKAYQSDIALELNLPKTTLWRIVRRLELRGYIKVEKRLRQNFLILRR
ncbi:MAG: hypothetical protein B6U69_01220 [Thermofilum sp. ex4484_15]|nr:MAG: hypothetical protein B6U69_01220 [Thermofilum sp. ex4484_15]